MHVWILILCWLIWENTKLLFSICRSEILPKAHLNIKQASISNVHLFPPPTNLFTWGQMWGILVTSLISILINFMKFAYSLDDHLHDLNLRYGVEGRDTCISLLLGIAELLSSVSQEIMPLQVHLGFNACGSLLCF